MPGGGTPGISLGIENLFFFQIPSEAGHLYAILRADPEYRIYISIKLNLVPEKQILLINRL